MKNKKEIFTKYPIPDKCYEHYKGGLYKFLTLAEHTETDEKLCIYQSLLFGSIHARPLTQWFEEVPNLKRDVISSEPMKTTRFRLITIIEE